VFLGVLAMFVSFALTGASAYVLSSFSGNRSEAQLSALVRFFLSPLIAAITGALVGVFSADHPLYLIIVGLAPWALTLLASATRPNALDLLDTNGLGHPVRRDRGHCCSVHMEGPHQAGLKRAKRCRLVI